MNVFLVWYTRPGRRCIGCFIGKVVDVNFVVVMCCVE